jgi:GNAT superfamily N-acetyltransferase
VPLKAYTLRERPDFEPDFDRLAEEAWPRFLRQRDALGLGGHWPELFTVWADWQVALYDDAGTVAAVAHAAPLAWDGTPEGLPASLAGVLEAAAADRAAGRRPTALATLTAVVARGHRRRGLGRRLLEAVRFVATARGLGALLAPVRPAFKERYPLAPLERYARWITDGGEPFDPWMRVHARLGGEVLRLLPRALVIAGTVPEWEEWTEMVFPESGPYVVPGALQPVMIDRERDEGRYEDPAVWMRHLLDGRPRRA